MWHMVLINLMMVFFIADRAEPIKGLLRPLTSGNYLETNLILVSFLVLTCVIGYLSYRFLENPTRVWLKSKLDTDDR